MNRMTQRAFQILLALTDGPLHGYGIRRGVVERTDGRVKMGSGTLYEAIQRLEAWGWIQEVTAPQGEPVSGGPPRRYYALTRDGETALSEELRRMDAVVRWARSKDLLKA